MLLSEMSIEELQELYKTQQDVLCLRDIDGNNTEGKYGVIINQLDNTPNFVIKVLFRQEYIMYQSHEWYIPAKYLECNGNSKSFLDI